MQERIYNKDNLTDSEITKVITRVKLLMINSENKILLGYGDGIYQFPGGHVEENEKLEDALKREIEEETGIKIDIERMKPFYLIKHYTKNYKDTGENKLSEIYYYFTKIDEKADVTNTKYTEREKAGHYKLEYVDIDNLEKVLTNNIPNNKVNKTIVEEMMSVVQWMNTQLYLEKTLNTRYELKL